MKKYLIAGLGNIGAEYRHTRHNIGFEVADHLAASEEVSFKTARYADVVELSLKNKKLLLIKPSTYMNRSGKALRYWMREENIPLENVLVVLDDVALDLGVLRIKKKGSDGGHNGLKDINQQLGRQDYPRMRVGIGNDYPKGAQIPYVLGQWTPEQLKVLESTIPRAAEAIRSFVLAGVDNTMNQYNG